MSYFEVMSDLPHEERTEAPAGGPRPHDFCGLSPPRPQTLWPPEHWGWRAFLGVGTITERQSVTVDERLLRLALWQGEPHFEILEGGVSNVSFKVTDARGIYVARVGEDFPFHQVNRSREAIAARAAFRCGLSPETIHVENGVMVMRYLTTKTYNEADVRANWSACIDLVARCHRDMGKHITGQGAIFWVFQILRDYAETISHHNHPHTNYLREWIRITDEMEQAQVPLPIVFGHHDLLPANILDDGKRLWLIDWEYGAFGTAMFDLANLAANNSFDEKTQAEMLRAYFSGSISEATQRAFDAMTVASALRETMWGIVSELKLNAPGVDYNDYTAKQLSRFEKALRNYRTRHGEK
jgi:thiamine kinase-like enzyme